MPTQVRKCPNGNGRGKQFVCNKFHGFIALCFILLLVGCGTKSHVKMMLPETENTVIKHACVIKNEQVKVADFLSVLQEGFNKHGIQCSVVNQANEKDCPYTVTYIAEQSWDLRYFLGHAEIKVYKFDKLIGHVTYDVPGGTWNFDLANKFKDTRSKILPLIDELLFNIHTARFNGNETPQQGKRS
jgi:hypothetical protein